MPSAITLIAGLGCLLACLILVLSDRFSADEAEHPTHDRAGNVR